MSTLSDAVDRWWRERVNDLALEAPLHVHLDELLGSDYASNAAAKDGQDAYIALLALLGERVEEIKAIGEFPLATQSELVTDPPDVDKLDAVLDTYRPPSLVLVAREAFGRTAVLMERYERPLRVHEATSAGYLVWSYRTWRSEPDSPEYWRAVYLEHYLEVPRTVT